ncbi:MAG: hypothetical protein JWR85_3441, partial [Marmoricola sp.]|nr:hypothetical protein [Marmoricola sp.]
AANAAIGTAAATVDGVTTFTINQTTANITLTMPNPTATTAGRIVYISNIGTASFTMYNVVVSPGNTATYLWNGSAWTSAGIDGSGANYIQNQSGSTQSANFKISGTGVANLLQASTFDAASATTMNLGTTNATGVNLATNAIAHAISIGTGAAAQTVTIGSTNTTSTTTLQAGSGSVNLFGNTSSLTTATARVLQGGTGDALLEFNNSGLGKSFYIGQDTSSGGNFIINSSTSATASTVSTPTFVQSITVGSTASATTTASTFTTTAGNLIVVSLSFASTGTTFTCTDDRGDTFSNAAQVTSSGQTAGICYAANVAGGSTTVTVTYGAASTYRAIILSEYSGVATSNPVDVTSVNTGTATTATDNVTSNIATTTQTGNLIVGLVDDITGNAVVSAGTGYTPRQASAAGERILVQDKVFNGTGTVASTNTFSTPDAYNSVLVAFKPVVTTGTNTDNFANPVLSISQSGSTTFRGVTNSTVAFQVQNSSGVNLMTLDTSNSRITLAGDVNLAGNLSLGGTIEGAGLATDCSAQNSKLLWSSTTKQFSCGTDRASVNIAKTVDETVTNSTALQNDDQFFFSIGANEVWSFEINMASHSNATAGFKFNMNAPAGATCRIVGATLDNGDAPTATGACSSITVSPYPFNGTNGGSKFYGTITNGATAGTANFRWAQDTANAVATNVFAGSYMVGYKMTGADLAETYYTKDMATDAGDVVSIDSSIQAGVKKSTSGYDPNAFGIVSTRPGIVIGEFTDTTAKPVNIALTGRVPVKVTTENGSIQPGDFLTTSAMYPGYAMKATGAGMTIGTALESYTGSGPGKVMAFARIGWQPGDSALQQGNNSIQNGSSAELSGLTVSGNATVASLNVSGPATLASLTVSGSVTIERNLTVKDSIEVAANLTVKGYTKLQDLEIGGHLVTAGDTPAIHLLGAAGTNATVSIEGNDTSGTVTIVTGPAVANDRTYQQPSAGDVVNVRFVREYGAKPRIMLMGSDVLSVKLEVYPGATDKQSFSIGLGKSPEAGRTYVFEYFVVQ